MKKLFSVFAVLAIACMAWAAPDFPSQDWPSQDFPQQNFQDTDFPNPNRQRSTALETSLKQQVGKPAETIVSGVPHEDAVFHIKMKVVSRFVGQMQEGNNEVTKRCAAVRIDNRWMIASLTCRGTSAIATAHDHYGEPYDKRVDFRHIKELEVEGVKVNAEREVFVDENAKAILIYLNPTNIKLMQELKDKKAVAPIIIPANPTALLNFINEAFINRENFCLPGRCSPQIEVQEYCQKSQCYKIERELIDGDAGDPLFIRSAKKKEYLVALNVAEIDGNNVGSGRYYRIFNQATDTFLQKVIGSRDKQAYSRIQANMLKASKF